MAARRRGGRGDVGGDRDRGGGGLLGAGSDGHDVGDGDVVVVDHDVALLVGDGEDAGREGGGDEGVTHGDG